MLLHNKKILITGLLSKKSIAYGIAKACYAQGASLAFTYVDERFKDRVLDFATEFNSSILIKCDVALDEDLENTKTILENTWGSFDGFVHSIAFADKQSIAGDFLEGVNRSNFSQALDISAYSFAAMAKALAPILNPNAALVTLSYLGAERVVANYNTMGVAKAALEAVVRYTAQSLGDKGIRVNAISAGPIKTLAASGIKDFSSILQRVEQNAPLKRNVTIDEVGNTAAFLLSSMASGITAEIIYVDGGFHAVVS